MWTSKGLLQSWQSYTSRGSAATHRDELVRALGARIGEEGGDRFIAEQVVLEASAPGHLPGRSDPRSPDVTVESFRAVFGDGLEIVSAVELEMALTSASKEVARLLPGLGSFLLDEIDQIHWVDGPTPFLAGTSLVFPGRIFLSLSLANDRVRLAEHLLHEAVHVAFYRSYFQVTPLMAEYFLHDFEYQICAVWHDPEASSDGAWWWGLERALHAYIVNVHLVLYWLARLREATDSVESRTGLRSSLFCANFLGRRLIKVDQACFAPLTQQLLHTLVADMPTSFGIDAAEQRYGDRGLRHCRRINTERSHGRGPACPTSSLRYELATGDLAIHRLRPLSFTFEASGVKDSDSGGRSQRAVDGASLREMLLS